MTSNFGIHPDDTLSALIIQPAGKELLRITGTGEVIIADELRDQPDAAARAMWDALLALNPVLAMRDRIAALEAAGDVLYDALANDRRKWEPMAQWEKVRGSA